MAKSLRSKWKRKMRSVKRVRYAVKELAKLNDVVQNQAHLPKQNNGQMKETTGTVETMETDSKPKRYKNLKDQSGHYPEWLHPRKIRKLKFKQKARLARKK